jgi:hypothetical protein
MMLASTVGLSSIQNDGAVAADGAEFPPGA